MSGKQASDYTLQELMAVEGSRHLRDGEIVFVGTGLPIAATMLAQLTHAPNLIIIIETGPIDPRILPTPLAVSDARIWYRAAKLGSIFDVEGCILQGGRCDVGFLGGAQIDQYGNINSTIIGEYPKPKVRLVGSGGANDIASSAKRILIITRHEKRRFPRKCDYITSPGFVDGPEARKKLGLRGGGPDKVITDLCVMGFDEESKRMMLLKLHPGVTLDKVKEETGFELLIPKGIETTQPPTQEQIRLLREEIDPQGIYLGKRK